MDTATCSWPWRDSGLVTPFKRCEMASPPTVLVGGAIAGEEGGILAGSVRTCTEEAPEPEPCIFLECSISVSWKVTASIPPSPAPLCTIGILPTPSAKLGVGGGSLQPGGKWLGASLPLIAGR